MDVSCDMNCGVRSEVRLGLCGEKKVWLLFFLMVVLGFPAHATEKVVIAHRAASGYLMEHNLPSVTLAVALGSDYIEQDLVMTKDDQIIVLNGPVLDLVTNVSQVFPKRSRKDGKFYAMDFTLAEIKQLSLKEPYSNVGNGAGRFPDNNKHLQLTVPTLREELELIRGLEKTLGREIGVYPEIKQPWLHMKEGKDISRAVLLILREYGYTKKSDKIFLQCFDPEELKRIHTDLLPALQMDLKLTQLLDDNNGGETKYLEWGEWLSYNYDWIRSKSGLRAISAYVSAIGMDKSMLVDEGGLIRQPELINDIHSLGMVVHAFTFRREKEALPAYIVNSTAPSFEALLEFFFFKVGVDGVFTDYCGDVVEYLQQRVAPAQPVVPLQPQSETVAPPAGTAHETLPGMIEGGVPVEGVSPTPGKPDLQDSPDADPVERPSSGSGIVPIPAPSLPVPAVMPSGTPPAETNSVSPLPPSEGVSSAAKSV